MAYVERLKSGRHRARRRVDGKLVSKSFDTASEAWAWAEGRTVAGPPAPAGGLVPSAPTTTVGEFLDAGGYVTVNQRETTQDFTDGMIRKHIRPRWGDIALASITHTDVQRWVLNEVNDGTRKASTVHHVAKQFSRILKAAVRAGLIPANPADGIVLPQVQREEMNFLGTDEIDALFRAFDKAYRAFVPVCAFGGLRIGEALALRYRDVDLMAGRISVWQNLTYGTRTGLTFGAPKTKAGVRTIPIPRVAVNAIADHSRRPGVDSGADALVFPAPRGGAFAPHNFRRRHWEPAAARADLGRPTTPHDLRHTAISLWIASGASAKEVSVRAGHSSVAFTLDRYGHLYGSEDAAFAARLDTLIRKGVTRDGAEGRARIA